PEPGTLILGKTVVDMSSGKSIMDAPGPVRQWAGPNRVLVHDNVLKAVNRKALEESVDYFIMLGVFVNEFNRDEYDKKAAAFATGRKDMPVTRSPTAAADRSGVTAIHAKPDAAWTVKPSAAPLLTAGASCPVWPDAVGTTEGAASDGRTWQRYDLK